MPGMSNAKLVCSQVRTANAMTTSTPTATSCFTEHFAHGEFHDAFDWTTRWVMPIGMACGFFRKPGILTAGGGFARIRIFLRPQLYGTISKPR
jgi:hypothetical protein